MPEAAPHLPPARVVGGRRVRPPRSRGSYPQVDFRARGLMTEAVVTAPATLAVGEVEGLLRRRHARLLVARWGREWGVARPETLARARALGLADQPVAAILWLAPAVAPGVSEIDARRAGGPADPAVVVADGSRVVGAILRDAAPRALPASATRQLAALPAETRRRLRAAGAAGQARGWVVAAVGGFVRDLLRGVAGAETDLDLAVEGDAAVLAQDLAEALGGQVRTHESFLTATVSLPGGSHIDVATARSERYARPGSLPIVVPADLKSDLSRRDFSVNALAIRLDGPAWGEIVDPHGGQADLRQRRLRVLHPLSFAEDPTRAFRAARFAARLGATADRSTRHLLESAAALSVFGALSGDRLRREIRLALAESRAGAVLEALATSGAIRLVAPGWASGSPARAAAARLRQLPARLAGLELADGLPEVLVLLAATAHLGEPAVARALTRLAVPPALGSSAIRALREGPEILKGLARAPGPAEAFALLRGRAEPSVAWALLTAPGPARRRLAAYLGDWRRRKPLLSGDDLLALGVARGPDIGRRLDALLAAQVSGRVTTRAQALRWSRTRAGHPTTSTKGG